MKLTPIPASCLFVVSVISCLQFVSCKTAETGDSMVKEAPTGDNSLHWWGLTPMRYDDLPLDKNLPKVPWPGDYWATFQGGISYRWQDPSDSEDYKDYLTKIPNEQDIKGFQPAEIDLLSPAEKYDLWQDRLDWTKANSATGYQRAFMLKSAKFNNDVEIPTWTGICNGWSLAAIYEDMPLLPVTVSNSAGQKITFYPGDIKALISQVYFDYQPRINVARLGAFCDQAVPAVATDGRITDAACRDTNPASFHTALGQYLAKDKPFVFDVEPAEETWNQPVYGYTMTLGTKEPIPATYKNAATGTVNVVEVTVDLRYIVEARPEKVGLTAEKVKKHIKTKRYSYTLELDGGDMILGGEWKKNSAVPDFMWRPDERPTDAILKTIPGDYPLMYSKVMTLVSQSSGQTPVVTPPTGGPIDDQSTVNPNAPVASSISSCKSCKLVLAPGGLAGRSNAAIKNSIRRIFISHGSFPFINENSIVVATSGVTVPLKVFRSVKVDDMKKWLAAPPHGFQLISVAAF